MIDILCVVGLYLIISWFFLSIQSSTEDDDVVIGRALFWPLMVIKFLVVAVVYLVKLLYRTIKREFTTLDF